MRIPQTSYQSFKNAIRLRHEITAINYFDKFFPRPPDNFDDFCCMLIHHKCYHVLGHVAKKFRCTTAYSDMYYILQENYTKKQLQKIFEKINHMEESDRDLYDLLQQAIESMP